MVVDDHNPQTRPCHWWSRVRHGLHVRSIAILVVRAWPIELWDSNHHPEVDKVTFGRFWRNLLAFGNTNPIYPHPLDQLFAGAKCQRAADLATVARTVTRTPHPTMKSATTLAQLRDVWDRKEVVIKREFSDSSTHSHCWSPDRPKKVMDEYHETMNDYGPIRSSGIPPPCWLIQPYIQELPGKGELRAFFADNKFKYCIHTWPEPDAEGTSGTAGMEYVTQYTPLDCLE